MRIELQNARKEMNLSQKKVAEYLKMTANAYQKIELGTRGTCEYNWFKLFDLFNKKIQLDKLMENTTTATDTINTRSGQPKRVKNYNDSITHN